MILTDIVVEHVIIVELVGPRVARPFAEQKSETQQGPSKEPRDYRELGDTYT